MDWMRRNWLDLLIALALFLVIAGIIATLINGGTILPKRSTNDTLVDPLIADTNPTVSTRGTTMPPVATTPTTTTTSNTVNAISLDEPNPTTTVTTPAPMRVPLINNDNSTNSNTGTTASTSPTPISLNPPVSPDNSSVTTTTTEVTTNPVSLRPTEASGTVSTASSTTTTSTTSATSDNSADGNTRTAILTQLASVPASAGGSSRVSVGAFGNAENAASLANRLRAQNLPANVQTSGDYTVVYLGPYTSFAQAERVASQAKAAGIVTDTQVYGSPSTQSIAAAPSQPVQPTVSSPSNVAVVGSPVNPPTTIAVSAPLGSTSPTMLSPTVASPTLGGNTSTTTLTTSTNSTVGRYLQVGAYRDIATALPQRQRLESLGYVVFDRIENNMVKLIIGPYRSDELVNMQSRLRAQGIDSFPTR